VQAVWDGLFGPDDATVRERILAQALASPQNLLADGASAIGSYLGGPADQRYAGLSMPVAFVAASGAGDAVRRMQPLRPSTRFAQVIGSGHYVQVFAAQQVTAMIARFLELLEN
jgi:hypothetical protein